MLQSVSPLGASAGIPIYIIGTGFHTTAANNRVTFTPLQGEPVTVGASAILTVDATRDRRRLTVYVPAGLPAGTTALSVTNTVTGGVSSGVALQHLILSSPLPASSSRNVTGLLVTVHSSANTTFLAGSTTVNLGTGITTRSVEVLSPTQVVAKVDIAATAPFGPRTLLAQTTNQSLRLANAFTVVDVPPNSSPVANANGPYAGETGAAISFTSKGSSDPDGDPLSFAWSFGDGASSTDANPSHTYASPGTFNVALTVNDGKGGTTNSTTTAVIAQANRPPRITSSPVLSAAAGQPYAYQVTATDPDNDGLTFTVPTAPSGMTMGAEGGISWTPTANQVGPQSVSVQVSDGRGGTDVQPFTIDVSAAPVVLSGIDATPATIRFAAIDATRALAVLGRRSDGSTFDVTAASTGTTYSSSHPFIASVSADGVVTAHGNGEASISVANGGLTDSVGVVVEVGVTLNSLELTPPTATLRLAGATQALVLKGIFSDGSIRDLTASPATSFESSAAAIATVSGAGLVTAVANGQATVLAKHGDLEASAELIVSIPAGAGFVHGAVFDDSRGLPLAGATVTLLSDGGGPLTSSLTTIADDRGRYALPAQGGAVVLRIEKPGFTSVDRAITLPADGVTRALDARLTPVDPRPNSLQSAFGGQARDASGSAFVTIGPGALQSDADVRVTMIGSQGAAARLPLGWSPVAGAEVGPATATFGQAASLVVPNVGGAAAGVAVTLARYDRRSREWIVLPSAMVSSDGRTIAAQIETVGPFVIVVPDTAPHVPPVPIPRQPLQGVDAVAMPDSVTADGQVTPRAAPPGESARAVGRIGLQSPSPLPSGSVLQVHVSETFELLDTSTVAPLPFTQDILLHARPRPPDGGALGTTFPITPSRNYSVQELMRGIVKLDVSRVVEDDRRVPAGPQGANVTDVEGDALTIAAGTLATETLVQLRRATNPGAAPAGLELLVAVDVDLIGAVLTGPAALSVPRPAGLSATDQILLVHSFLDPTGIPRLRVAGLGRQDGDRLTSQTTLGTLNFPGVTTAGRYYFLKASAPVGFVTGTVATAGGAAASAVLVTSANVPLADVTGTSGRYIVAALAGVDATIVARHLLTADTTTALARPSAREAVVVLPLTLGLAPPAVVAVSPASGAVNVPLDSSVTIDFSEAIDPGSITAASVTLTAGMTTVSVTQTLSQDRRRLTLRPAAPLAGKTTFTVVVTSDLRDASGLALVAFSPVTFTTLDPTKPPQLPPGQLVAEMPDADGFTLIVATAGTAEPSTPVTATNLRTQETATVMSLDNGAFRIRLSAVVGDEISLTLRDAAGRETSVRLAQFRGEGGAVAMGAAGGSFSDESGRLGSVLPNALVSAGVFRFESLTDALITLPPSLAYVDRFRLDLDGAEFNRLVSLSLTEGQNRFAPAVALGFPFDVRGELTVPGDFLLNASLRFSALAVDGMGIRRTVTVSTAVVAANPDTGVLEIARENEFPTVFLSAPKEALQNQIVTATALAPAARIDLRIPAPASSSATYLLVRAIELSGEPLLSVVDILSAATSDAGAVLMTAGRTLPGMSEAGNYAVIGSSEPLVFVTGRLAGAAGIVSVDGLPFVVETHEPNGRFAVPVPAGQPFRLRFRSPDGVDRGTTAGQAPPTGSIDVGDPLGSGTGQLSVTADPSSNSIVDIGQPLVLRFSEPIAVATLATGVVVTDPGGARVFGTFDPADGSTVTFRPLRRWRYGTTYRVGVATSVLGRSGARLAQPFVGEFATFAPSIRGSANGPRSSDVDVHGTLASVAAENGLIVLDISSPAKPTARATVPLDGGAGGVAMLSAGSLVNGAGATVAGSTAVVVSGDRATGGRLDVFELSDPASPALLGGLRLTAAQGEPAPSGVVDAAGTPRQVVISEDGRALVAVADVGLLSVDLRQTISSNPGPATGRYPSIGVESVTGVALLPGRVVVAGAAGLTVVDGATLARIGLLSADGPLAAVAVLPSYAMDIDGDGVVGTSEVFDLAVATGVADGTVRFFRIPQSGDPVLLSVVRLLGEVAGVALSREERLAYVSSRSRGLTIVDLDGPVSVQPLDSDRNGRDDRVLFELDTPFATERAALVMAAGLGALAESSGLTIAQLLPPRARFTSLLRDPVRVITSDEQSATASSTAYLTDDVLRVTVDAVVPALEQLVLVIEEDARSSGVPALSLSPSGGTVVALTTGHNVVDFTVSHGDPTTARKVRLVVRTPAGKVLASRIVDLVPANPGSSSLRGLFMGPAPALLSSANPAIQTGVAGLYEDGRIFNLSTAATGTLYRSDRPAVAFIDASGTVTAVAGGRTSLRATNGNVSAALTVAVDLPPALVALESPTAHLTFRSIGEEQVFPVVGHFSDDSHQTNVNLIPGLTFSSSDPGVASVSSQGGIRAGAAGTTRISAGSGALQVAVDVVVDPRTSASINSIDVLPPAGPLSLDRRPIVGRAVISGTGSLDGHPVSVTLAIGGTTFTVAAVTQLDGSVEFGIDPGGQAGQVTATASIVDPATGQTRSDAQAFTIEAATGDLEPNGELAAAAPLGSGLAAEGTLNGTTDRADTFRFSSDLAGTLDVTLAAEAAAGDLVLVLRDAAGVELSRTTLTGSIRRTFTVDMPAGATFVTLESLSGASYELSTRFTQAPVAVSSVSPSAGPAGTLVTIDGAGFSTTVSENQVFFAGISAEVVTATLTRLQVRVPENAPNGPIEVISGDRRTLSTTFSTGTTAVPPPAFVIPGDRMARRLDPTTNTLVDISRLSVTALPSTTRASVESIAAAAGGHVVGYIPLTHQYVLQFPQITSFDALSAMRAQIAGRAGIREVALSRLASVEVPHPIDLLDDTASEGRAALELIHLFDAIDLVRRTPPFINRSGLREVKAAVLDTGFKPSIPTELPDGVVEYLERDGSGTFRVTTNRNDPYPTTGHGTPVSSIIGALNDHIGPFGGILNSLVSPDEAPFGLVVYGANDVSVDEPVVAAAIANIKSRGDIDVVNMSFGGFTLPVYVEAMRALRGRTLVVASAGNDAMRFTKYPAALAMTEPHVVAVGGVGVSDQDGTGEGADNRARWSGLTSGAPVSRRCDPTDAGGVFQKGSNCGPEITLSAPGEEVLAMSPAPNVAPQLFNGTSAAAPVVTGVAAILQTIRPTPLPLAPGQLKQILRDTATDISSLWGQPMRRINALAAVESLLSISVQNTVLIADPDAPVAGGGLIAMSVNPLSGQPETGPGSTVLIDLSQAGVQVTNPRTIAVSAPQNKAFVYANGGDPWGDGVVIVDLRTRRATGFVPLSGAVVVTNAGTALTPVRSSQPRPAMVPSHDGRLLYVAADATQPADTQFRIHIVNIEDEILVRDFSDLPSPYDARASTATDALGARLSVLANELTLGAANGTAASRIASLALSPDGKRLYLGVQNRAGTGSQPGHVMVVDVDLYGDADPLSDGMQPGLSRYLKAIAAFGTPSSTTPSGDEPSDVAASPDGRFLYMTNGGVESFSPPGDGVIAQAYALRVASQSTNGTQVIDPNLRELVLDELDKGATIVSAPGMVEGFQAASGNQNVAVPRFNSSVNHGWQPSADSGGLVLSQVKFGSVFAKRPFSLSIRPDGQRAIVAYFQTGNFGIMDLEEQRYFVPSARTVPDGSFAGILGVTPALELDKNLWPSRALFQTTDGNKASPDERLLFPTHVEYAQNGRFAVAIHTGANLPGQTVEDHQGGAVSFISDDAISVDLSTNANKVFEPNLDGMRAYYSMRPICETPDPAVRGCLTSVVTSLFDYSVGGSPKRFARPRGVGIAPILSIPTPRFGDYVNRTSEFAFRWVGSPTQLRVTVLDMGLADSPSAPFQVNAVTFALSSSVAGFSATFERLGGAAILPGHRYRFEFTLQTPAGPLSTSSVEVVLKR